MANTFQIWKELQANFIDLSYSTRARLRVNVYKEFIVTVHNFHQFEKVEWKNLVQAEIEARK